MNKIEITNAVPYCGTCRNSHMIEVPIRSGDDTLWIPCPECCPFDSAEELRAFEGISHEDATEVDYIRNLARKLYLEEFDGSGIMYEDMFNEPAWISRV